MALDLRRQLRDAGVEAYDMEARLLAAAATGKTREELLRDARLYVTHPEHEAAAADMLRRRLQGEPVAYIAGEWEFYSLPILVTRDVLIPRADTEVLAETAIRLLRSRDGAPRVLDLCAGSGCVGLAVAANVPGVRAVLAELDPAARDVCNANIRKNDLRRRVMCIEADAAESPPKLLGRFDIIVCNPPYIPTDGLARLDASVRDYEPRLALDGGADGLRFYRTVSEKWRGLLKQNGVLAFECGAGQAPDVRAVMVKNGFTRVTAIRDTRDLERVVIGIAEN
ncbi:MAG: peptide chain release factor N(5)-glutamine methyltransferase [Oscillospiraceae bacterium]|jgi:release factor glutamine methyltransferase|nr:peptide chain release factor N(5)-glutamine methyltransferase [Oscillospiraceae bacterium]